MLGSSSSNGSAGKNNNFEIPQNASIISLDDD